MQNTKEITIESRLFEVVMLPTKDDSHIQTLKTNEFEREGTLRYYKGFISESETAKPQHLYLLADGYPIKPGDYYYSMMGNYKYGVSKCTVEDEQCNEAKTPKVVATTDPTLGLPLIQQSFVEEYVAAVGDIKHVYVKTNSPVCKCDSYEKASQCPFSCGEDCNAPNPNNDFYGLMPLVEDNTVTILPKRMLLCDVRIVPEQHRHKSLAKDIVTYSDDDLVLITSKSPMNINKLCFYGEYDKSKSSILNSLQPQIAKQNLYLISERKIEEKTPLGKDGDWYWNSKFNFVSNIGDITDFDFKVEATTNPQLGLPLIPHSFTAKYVKQGVATAMIEMITDTAGNLKTKTDGNNDVKLLK